MPYVRAGSGTDVFTHRLSQSLRELGANVRVTRLSHYYQYFPFLLKLVRVPDNVQVIVANSWNGFAFKRSGAKLVVVEHHCVLDPRYRPYRTLPQACYHEIFVRPFEWLSFRLADAVVAVSQYTAQSVESVFKGCHPRVIYNGIETDFFCPEPEAGKGKARGEGRVCELLYVGNLSRRKGADLLPAIMDHLGEGFHLKYTEGLREENNFPSHPRMTPLKRLSNEALRQAYRDADLFLFPSRFEGFGYAPAEAMACGIPAVVTRASALPEVVNDDVTGRLCQPDEVSAFVRAVRELATDRARLLKMGQHARQSMVDRFSLPRMAEAYLHLFQELLKE